MSSPADLKPDNDTSKLAPQCRVAVEAALAECNAQGVDVIVYEAGRTDALQQVYFARGASKAQSVLYSWHGYLLAADTISKARGWDVWPTRASDGSLTGGDPTWYTVVVATFKKYGLDWGGDWEHFPDMPHFQWGKCKPSPSDEARELFASGGVEAVWQAVGAA